MINRNLRIALLLSLGLHVFMMSAVTIITPEGIGRTRAYTKVDFLGPILKKTAFDIMIENASPILKTTYRYANVVTQSGYLDISVSKREPFVQEFPEYLENNMDSFVMDYLSAPKAVPDFSLESNFNDSISSGRWNSDYLRKRVRRVIYKPDPPVIMRSLYGGEENYKVKVKALVSEDGNVRQSEPLTTTGYPELDIMGSKFVQGWIFEPAESPAGADEWIEVDVMLKAGTGG